METDKLFCSFSRWIVQLHNQRVMEHQLTSRMKLRIKREAGKIVRSLLVMSYTFKSMAVSNYPFDFVNVSHLRYTNYWDMYLRNKQTLRTAIEIITTIEYILNILLIYNTFFLIVLILQLLPRMCLALFRLMDIGVYISRIPNSSGSPGGSKKERVLYTSSTTCTFLGRYLH